MYLYEYMYRYIYVYIYDRRELPQRRKPRPSLLECTTGLRFTVSADTGTYRKVEHTGFLGSKFRP